MKVFLTGATGYVGHQLALELAKNNYEVHALVRDVKSVNVPKQEGVKVFAGNICDLSSILKAMKGCDYVFHTAAYTNLKCRNIDNFYNVNVLGTENILKAALELKVKKVIYTSTLSVYGPSYNNVPISESQPRLSSYKNDYELTKKMSEEKITQYTSKGLSCITLNVSKVYGPGLNTFSNGINSLINLFMKKDVLFVPNHLQVASNYVYIEDVVRAHILTMESHIATGRFIIGGENISYEVLFNKIKTQLKSETKIVKVNFSLVKSALSLINAFRNIIGKPSILTRSVLDSIFTYRVSTSQKAISELKYQPTAFELGIKRTINSLNYSK